VKIDWRQLVVVLAPAAADERRVQAFDRTEPEIGRAAIYRVYFHGPAYRVLDRVEGAGEGKVIVCHPDAVSPVKVTLDS